MESKFCECGCGRDVKPGNRFLVGHSGGQPNLGCMVEKVCPMCEEIFIDRVLPSVNHTFCGPKCSAQNARKHMLKTPSKETREKISKTLTATYSEGRFTPFWYYDTGYITLDRLNTTLYYRSSYEKKALELLDMMSDVISVETEKIQIKYQWDDGSNHYYLPDFFVQDIDRFSYLIEVKSNDFINARKSQLKFLSAYKYCQERSIKFLIWTEDLLHSTNNGSTTASLQEIAEATVATLSDGKVMIQSDLYGNIEKGAEMAPSLMEVCNV